MKNIILIAILIYGFMPALIAQEIKGKVYYIEEQKKVPVVGANVYWMGTTIGTVSDENGSFSIAKSPNNNFLIISYVGYKTDTANVSGKSFIEVTLKSSLELGEVEVIAKDQSSFTSLLNPIQTVKLTEKEIQKAACCNLSESFETTASVDVAYSDAVTGAKEIRMLGLDGVYTQILAENMPFVRGLSAPYGIAFMPGPWLESIYIAKGTGSVVNGYEAFTGQINAEVREPEKSDRLFVNLFADHEARTEANIHLSHRLNKKVSTILLTHGAYSFSKADHNDDGFLDMPLVKRVNLFNRWKYEGDQWKAQAGLNFLKENRQGGQVAFDPEVEINNQPHYGISIDNLWVEGFAKSGRILSTDKGRSISLVLNGSHFDQSAFYGKTPFEGLQNTIHGDLMYQSNLFNDQNIIKLGASYTYDQIEEQFGEIDLDRIESIPGAFAEYTFNKSRWAAIAGVRLDNNSKYGLFFTPKVNVKYQPNEYSVLRVSAGKAYRTANVLSENAEVLVSSRDIVIMEDLLPEEAWNAGINFTLNFDIKDKEGNISFDYYRTQFINQVVADLDQDIDKVLFYNLNGESYSNSFQSEINYELFERFDVRLAYVFNDVWTTYNGLLMQRPLIARHKALLNLAYSTPFDKWEFDFTTQWNGTQRLPSTSGNPEEFQREEFAPAYFNLLGQVTKNFKRWSVYLGGENLLGFTQKNPIIAANDPFGPYFDASMVWGPISGRKVYAGLRYSIPYKY